jgi:hypothetical protein
VKKGPPGHCIVSSSTGVEATIRNAEILLDKQWVILACSPKIDPDAMRVGGV